MVRLFLTSTLQILVADGSCGGPAGFPGRGGGGVHRGLDALRDGAEQPDLGVHGVTDGCCGLSVLLRSLDRGITDGEGVPLVLRFVSIDVLTLLPTSMLLLLTPKMLR